MRSTIVIWCTLAFAMLTSFSGITTLSVTSTAFKNDGPIPRKYTCEGRGINPPLQVDNIPTGTRSLAITLSDPDAELSGGYTHWVIWNIGVNGKIRANFKGGVVGANTVGERRYEGMCPPVGTHHYHFMVYALDTKLDIDNNTHKTGLEEKMRGHILAKGELVGLYQRRKIKVTMDAEAPMRRRP